MFGLLYQECLQTGPLVFIWIFHFILPRVIRLFRVYWEWWIISFTPLHSLKTCWMARACPKGGGYVCVVCPWLDVMAPRVHDRCLTSLQLRQHLYSQCYVWACKTHKLDVKCLFLSLQPASTMFLQESGTITCTSVRLIQHPCDRYHHWLKVLSVVYANDELDCLSFCTTDQ